MSRECPRRTFREKYDSIPTDFSSNKLTSAVIGIHLGRSESRVGGIKDGKITVFTGHGTDEIHVPSAVAWTNEGLVVGQAAREANEASKDTPDLFAAVLDIRYLPT